MTTSTTATPSQNGDSHSGPHIYHHHNPVDEVIVTEKLEVSRIRGSDRRMVNQYEFEKCLGKGQHGQVWVARDTLTSQVVAIKMLKRKDKKAEKLSALRKRNIPSQPHVPLVDKMSTTEMKILKEIAIMKKLRHPHVVRLLEVMDDHLLKEIYLVMEYCAGGEIKWRTKNNEPILRVSQTRRIIRDVILGLEYLHFQGIIHRDIKPANLFWSEDRRIVKIGDFGVSHFSQAQRAAVSGNEKEEEDPILLDESDLSRFAGTPMFLAPEVVADTYSDPSTLSTSTSDTPNESGKSTPKLRPPITKAIDIWALGVTIYCLLFGSLPFNGDSEFAIYRSIREDDWDVPETMGVDHIPTGGRHQAKPKKGRETEGFLLMSLLEGLLQKDPSKRLTLDGAKKHPWILKDMSHPDIWLRTTQMAGSIAATDAEASSALSFVRFKWTLDLARGISGFFRSVRPQRSLRPAEKPEKSRAKGKERQRDDLGTRSMPSVLTRQKSITIGVHEREKQKRRGVLRSSANQSAQDVRQHRAHDNRAGWRHSSHHAKNSEPLPSGSGLRVEGSGPKPRRSSAPGPANLDTLNIPSTSRIASPRPTHASSRQPNRSPHITTPIITTPSATTPSITTPSPLSSDTEDRGRNRFSLSASAMYRWVTGRSGAPSPQEMSSSALASGAVSPATAPSIIQDDRRLRTSRDLALRRSEDALHQASSRKSSSSSGPLTLAMRAASWGEVGVYRPSEDIQSIHSGEPNDETLDDETRFVGAGGYAQSPVPSLPSGVLSTVSSAASIGQPAFNAAQALLHRGGDGPPTIDLTSRPRSHATSPLGMGAPCRIGRQTIKGAGGGS
ncbi:hypothetical protein NM688_g563 [Phlebia brevispora]|uniref:Uncharacterized protein n=1 Tax=Phlebia brevispora TaxID=194682 RepID=A0ACC1TE47_9APHY|nr:hypothetical protein NM688_g563 [Phlebia brevispora]